jgi:hypothetical protein
LRAAEATQQQELFEDLVRLLAVHETAEEEVVHPTARRKLDHGDEVVESRLHEEDEAKRALTELYDLGVEHPAPEQGPPSWRARAPRAASPPKRPNPRSTAHLRT